MSFLVSRNNYLTYLDLADYTPSRSVVVKLVGSSLC